MSVASLKYSKDGVNYETLKLDCAYLIIEIDKGQHLEVRQIDGIEGIHVAEFDYFRRTS